MCGILGAYDIGAVDDRCVAAMSGAIAHRGPDADDRGAAADRSKGIGQLLTVEGWYARQGRDR